jgi:hypothetical protein
MRTISQTCSVGMLPVQQKSLIESVSLVKKAVSSLRKHNFDALVDRLWLVFQSKSEPEKQFNALLNALSSFEKKCYSDK